MDELNEIREIVGDADGLMKQLGVLGREPITEFRWNNLRRIVTRTRKKLEKAERKPKAIPPRLLVPLLESASLDDDKTLQDMWAGLLATASQEADKVSPSYVETLKQLTPDEARYFDKLYRFRKENARNPQFPDRTINPLTFSEKAGAPSGVTAETFERLGLIRRDYGLTKKDDYDEMAVGYLFQMTDYAMRLMKTCHADFYVESRESRAADKQFSKEVVALKGAIERDKARKQSK